MEQQSFRQTYRYQLTPIPLQGLERERVLMLCRHLYNAAVGERREAWRMRCVTVAYYQQKAEAPAIKEAMSEYAETNAQVLQDVVLRVERAFQAFLCRVKNGETPGYPRFQRRKRYNSFTYLQVGEHGGARQDSGYLILSKIGRIALRWSRPLEGRPKTVTISKEVDGWYVCFLCADVPARPLPPTGQETGVDLGIEAFATLSDAMRIFNSGWYRKAERALKMAQRRDSRRRKGSYRRRKAVITLAKAHQQVRRQRRDLHHKTALALVQNRDVIYHEDLQTANMLRNHHLAKSIADAGWSAFLSLLDYKAACAGRRVIAVGPVFTGQMCSGCGMLVQKSLSIRWHACPACGTSLHRDHNAAKKRERLGRSRRGAVA
jgi:putative transposase